MDQAAGSIKIWSSLPERDEARDIGSPPHANRILQEAGTAALLAGALAGCGLPGGALAAPAPQFGELTSWARCRGEPLLESS